MTVFDDSALDDTDALAGADTIIRRLAEAGSRILQEGTVTLTLSLGKERYDVPKVEGLTEERTREDMSSSKDRTSHVHSRAGEACPVCGDTIRAVEYASYTVNYCATCQTNGKILADNTTSKFLK